MRWTPAENAYPIATAWKVAQSSNQLHHRVRKHIHSGDNRKLGVWENNPGCTIKC